MTARAFLPRTARLIGAILLAALAAALGLAAPAAAHTTLKESDPAANSTVPKLPEVVRLTFSDLLPITPKVTVHDPDGVEVNSSPISPRGNTVLQPVKSTKAGRFTVTWEVTAPDGDKTNGTFAFTVSAPASPAADAGTSPTAPASVSASASAAPASAVVAASSPAAAASDTAQTTGGSGWLWVAVAVILVLLAAGGAVFFVRRRSA